MKVAMHRTLTGHHGGLPRFFQVLERAFRLAGIEVVDPEGGPDLVYAPSISFERAPDTTLPLVCTFHDAHWKHFPTFGRDAHDALEVIGREWMDRATLVCCSSEAMRAELAGFYPDRADKLRVVHLPPLVEHAGAGDALRRLRARGLPRRFAYMPAQAGVHKNHLRLLSAWSVLRARGAARPPTLVLSGMLTEAFSAPGGAGELVGLEAGVDLLGLGYVDDAEVRVLFERCELLVMPTLYDAGSFPVMEAMLMGVPVVASNLPSLVEQVRRQGAWCRFFDRFDPVDIARAIDEHVADPGRSRALARHARLSVRRESWDRTGFGYRRVFAEALARRVPTAPGARGLRVEVDVGGLDTPGAARWAQAARGLARRVADRLGLALDLPPPPGAVGHRRDDAPDLAFVLGEGPGPNAAVTIAGPTGRSGAAGRLGFGAPSDLIVPSPFSARGADARVRAWVRSRYALSARFALLVAGSSRPPNAELARMAEVACASSTARLLAACGDGTELVRGGEAVVGLGRVDDDELRALVGECELAIVSGSDGVFGVTARELAASRRPAMRWADGGLVDLGVAAVDGATTPEDRLITLLRAAGALKS